MDLEQLIKLSKTVARPYIIAVGVLACLLFVSVCGNIYQATRSYDITVEQQNLESDYSINGVIK